MLYIYKKKMEKFEVVEIEANKILLNHYKTYEIKKKINQ